MSQNRRDFLKFLGSSSLLTLGLPSMGGLATSCKDKEIDLKKYSFKPLTPTDKDELSLVSELSYEVLASYGDSLGKDISFGFNNDYIAMIPFKDKKDEAILWVNHEYPSPNIMNTLPRTKANIDTERKAVGGSLLHLKKNEKGHWQLVKNSSFNRRLSAESKIPFAGNISVAGSKVAEGTMANCAGGVTPWGHVLTCEENYHDYYGEIDFKSKERAESRLQWEKFYNNHPHHYGWVVEVNPFTGEAKKLTSLGRFAHESATTVKTKGGRCVVYSGDDKAGEFIYKFIGSEKDSLEKGELFVADLKQGKWLSLDINKSEILKKTFKDQLDVLINCRVAGRLLGATPCDRPEDVEVDPRNNNVFVCLTNNVKSGNFYGSILKIEEKGNDPLSLEFNSSDFLVGGEENGFACPDNMAFDKAGNLWMSTDISGSALNRPPYAAFKNNGLFYIPLTGAGAGIPHQVASAPVEAELTGIYFDADGKHLFLSVQHPGEKSKKLTNLTSHWPDGGTAVPRPSVVQIYGPLLDRLMQSKV